MDEIFPWITNKNWRFGLKQNPGKKNTATATLKFSSCTAIQPYSSIPTSICSKLRSSPSFQQVSCVLCWSYVYIYMCIVVYMLTHTFYEVKWWWWWWWWWYSRKTLKGNNKYNKVTWPSLAHILGCLMCWSCGVTCAVYLEIRKMLLIETIVDTNDWNPWSQ